MNWQSNEVIVSEWYEDMRYYYEKVKTLTNSLRIAAVVDAKKEAIKSAENALFNFTPHIHRFARPVFPRCVS